ncbi:hypothetical protein FRC08_017405 [Ceratobasidium sp. 394]|nr:hypothetical protein FRC08_017405 [Ceratobasidium sp. 394]
MLHNCWSRDSLSRMGAAEVRNTMVNSSALNFVTRLPVSITTFILMLACQTPSQTRSLQPRLTDTPYVFLSVCRQWREIALSDPRLWCSISLSDHIEHLPAHLTRSGDLPLNVLIDSSSPYESERKISRSLGLLMNHWSRIERLKISLYDVKIIELATKVLNDKANSSSEHTLKDISIHLDKNLSQRDHHRGLVGAEPYVLLPICATLRRISVRGGNFIPTYPRPTIELSMLSSISVGKDSVMTLSGLFSLLTLAPNLTSLSLEDCLLRDDGATILAPVLLPNIKTIVVHHLTGVDSLNLILRTFDMPNLGSFSFITALSKETLGKLDWDVINRHRGAQKLTLDAICRKDMTRRSEKYELCYFGGRQAPSGSSRLHHRSNTWSPASGRPESSVPPASHMF